MTQPESDQQLWRSALVRLEAEVAALPVAEREWIGGRLVRIAALQRELEGFFGLAGGPALCRDCQGECCARGRHHLTLVNLLGYLLAGEAPPPPDFGQTCPFLGAAGCLLPAGRRPFNCISFHCEAVEDVLSPADRAHFYAREGELRELYLAFDRRYAGSSLRGFLLRAEALGDRPFLERLLHRLL